MNWLKKHLTILTVAGSLIVCAFGAYAKYVVLYEKVGELDLKVQTVPESLATIKEQLKGIEKNVDMLVEKEISK